MKYSYILIFMILVSCKKECPINDVQKMMGKDFKRKLFFAKSIKLLNDNKGMHATSDKIYNPDSPYRVLHFFDADCSSCVEELQLIQEAITEKGKVQNLKYIFIGSSVTEANFKYTIKKSNIQFPVYYEKGYLEFKKYNSLPINDPLYNTILINEKNEILLFGSFFFNKKAQDLMIRVINCE